jgi:hypothetical protein
MPDSLRLTTAAKANSFAQANSLRCPDFLLLDSSLVSANNFLGRSRSRDNFQQPGTDSS